MHKTTTPSLGAVITAGPPGPGSAHRRLRVNTLNGRCQTAPPSRCPAPALWMEREAAGDPQNHRVQSCFVLAVGPKGPKAGRMAEGSKDQACVGAIDPEDDSPNMIIYRKTLKNISPLLHFDRVQTTAASL
ncbi:unnamed protein product [Gadus morhua 'NCC']